MSHAGGGGRRGELTSETIDPGTAPHLALTTEQTNDASGQETATRASDLTVSRSFYDPQGRVTKTVEDCTSRGTTTWASGDAGWKTCTGLGTQNVTWNLTTLYQYDDRGNKIKETAPNGRVTTWAYDYLGLTSQASPHSCGSATGRVAGSC